MKLESFHVLNLGFKPSDLSPGFVLHVNLLRKWKQMIQIRVKECGYLQNTFMLVYQRHDGRNKPQQEHLLIEMAASSVQKDMSQLETHR